MLCRKVSNTREATTFRREESRSHEVSKEDFLRQEGKRRLTVQAVERPGLLKIQWETVNNTAREYYHECREIRKRYFLQGIKHKASQECTRSMDKPNVPLSDTYQPPSIGKGGWLRNQP